MKKKVFSLMMALALTFGGMVYAQVSLPFNEGFESGLGSWTMSNCHSSTGVTTTSSYVHSGSSAFAFHWSTTPPQYLISPEIAGATEGLNVEFYYKAGSTGSYSETFKVGYSTSTNAVSAFTFGTEITAYAGADWTTYTHSFPAGTKYVAIQCTSYDALWFCIDDIAFTGNGGGGGGGGSTFEDKLHVKYINADGDEVIDSLNLGVRPIGAWMAPFEFTMYSEGPTYTINVLDFTPSDGLFTVEGEELPFVVTAAEPVDLTMVTNGGEAGVIERQFVGITEGDRAAHIWKVVVELYDPEIPDVVEKPCAQATNFPFVEWPATAHGTTLHNDYTLPFPEIPEGYDAVYKLVFDHDVMLNAEVTSGADGKVALYEMVDGELPHPMADNNYTGPTAAAGGSGGSAAAFEAQIGDGTNTTGYFPFYTLYNYSIASALYTAAELSAAGATTAPMSSMSFYATNSITEEQQNITIWMANVSDATAPAASPAVSGMTKVYTGSLPANSPIGWTEFAFNQGTFAWDGSSNVLIFCQRNCGDWTSSIQWQAHNPGFQGMSYLYTDSAPYNAETNTYSMTTSSTSRPNIILKATTGGSKGLRAGTMSYGPVITDAAVVKGTYYLVASSTDTDFEVTIDAADMPCPDVAGFAFNPTPADNEDGLEPASVTLRWSVPTYATEWRLVFGSTYHPEAGHPQTIITDWSRDLANSYTVRNLWNNTNYFWRVEFRNDSGCTEGVSSPIWGFTTHLNIPQNLTVEDETVFNDEQIVLHWNAVVDRTYRMYYIYRDGVKIGETDVNNINATTYTDGPLAYNMGGYTYYVTAVYDEGESDPSNTVNVKVSGYGDVDGHVYEQDGTTGIANATVTMVGQDEFGDPHTYHFTTNADGFYTGHVYAGSYNGSAACNGYQDIDEPVCGNPFAITYNNTTTPVDYILDENFYTPCSVVAEYYPDSLDPESPYVKVYWGCGLPGENIIEDFETGDFSMFDWQLDGTYPWVITTTNPYEGTYCMKSGNAGIASTTSAMQVTVDIPSDGLMSFFGKISSENNWDYGYFFIDGVQKGQYTGAGSWGEKKFDITAGTHTFKWTYTKDGSVNSNDDCFYVDYINFYKQPEPVGPGWHTYLESEFDNAYRSNVGDPSWGYEYPTSVLSAYAGFNLTKVAVFSDDMYGAVGGNFTCNVYVGGTTPAAGTLASTITVDVTPNLGAWCEYDLTTPVSVSGTEPIWVIWTVNSYGSSLGYPAGCASHTSSYGDWWNPGDGSGWEHMGDCTWTMKNYFTNGAGRTVVLADPETAPVNYIGSNLRTHVKGEARTAECINPNPVLVPMTSANNNRAFSHYRVYRTNCYNDGPYTEENTVVLSCELHDTIYIDVSWPDAAPGVYKWGVGCVYVGNRGEEVESPIAWTEPIVIAPEMANRDEAYDFENGQIPAGWTNDATYAWTVVEGNGGHCIRSGNSGMASTTSAIQTTVDFADNGTVSFDALCQGEGSSTFWDHCDFAIDGAVMFTAGANVSGWNSYSFPVSAGSHTFKWSYTKDSSVNPTGDAYFVDNVTFAITGGGSGGSGSGTTYGPGTDPIQEPRESVIIWSNCLDKDMYLSDVDINVLLNSADSPDGVTVNMTNLNEVEQGMYPVAPVVLDSTGFYAWDTFRKGEYAVKIEFEGYETINDTVSIWEATHLRYVMTEILYGVENIYVSRTGWAMWEDSHNAPIGGGTGGGGGAGGGGGTGSGDATVILTAGDIWGDGTGYQMLLDADHNAYGTTIPTTGALSTSCSGNDAIYGEFEYKIPTNADGNCSTSNIVYNNSVTITIPAGTYDWCITNPTPGDRIWIAAANGNVGGRQDDYVFEAGRTYEFTISMYGSNDGVDVTISGGTKNANAPLMAGEVKDMANVVPFTPDYTVLPAQRADERHLEYYKVMCTSIDGVPIFNHNTVHPFCQLSYNEPYNAPLVEGEHYLCKVACMYSTGLSAWSDPVEWVYEPCEHWGPVDDVAVTTNTQGNHIQWVFEHGFNPYDPGTGPVPPAPGDNATVILTAGDVWGDGSGYQMLLDADHNAYGTTIPTTGALSTNCSGNEAIYAEFEYKIPTNADGNCSTSNMVMNNSVSIEIPAGTYDWCITNPTPGDRIWIAAANGNVGGRQDDYVFEAGRTYTFTVSMYGSNDGVDVSISGGAKNGNAPLAAGEVKDIANVTPGNYGYIVRPAYSTSNMVGQTFTMTSESSLMFNIADIANFDERVYFLYKLMNDSRFSLINGEQTGMFVVNGSNSLNAEFVEFIAQNINEFTNMDKYTAADMARQYKAMMPNSMTNALMLDLYVQSRENNTCAGADPFCTDNGMYEFPAGVNAGSGEAGPDYDCLYTQPNPAWYYMRIDNPGAMDIYMYSTPRVDIDFCCWGPFDDPTTPCPYGLTDDKVVSCSYSTAAEEHCMIPATAQTGEYYILVITNYSNQTCNINFSAVGGTGSTDCGILPPVDIIGFLITQDGEYLAFAGPTDREYTDIDEFGDHEYCVRPIYPGEQVLPDHNYGWSMGCPVCNHPGGGFTCDPGEPIHADVNNVTDEVTVWWGEQPAAPISEWLYYDDGVYGTSIGVGGGTIYWASMFPSSSLGAYAGTNLTKVALYENGQNTDQVTVSIYLGGATAPQTLVSTMNYTPVGGDAFHEVTLTTPVAIDGTQNLWIVFSEYGQHPANACVDTGDANNRWVSLDGSDWMDVATAGVPGYGWMIRGFVTNQAKGGMVENIALEPVHHATVETSGMTLGHTEVVSMPADLSFMHRSDILSYNVYRSDDNVNYAVIGNVPYVEGQTYYEYIDAPGAGTYYYQVTAVYDGCESEPAPAYDNPAQNYVVAEVTGVGENSDNVALYPNPTSGNVTIEANGMSRITVMSVLGQVVYDTEVKADNYTLNMAQFNAGMYMVRVYTESGVVVKRVTVMQ